jgi:hypothetical protein
MLHRICLIAGIVSTLIFMTPAVARDYSLQKHHWQRYGHVHAHQYYARRYYVRRGYVLPRGGGLFGCRHWSPVGVYWTCYFW